MPDPTAVDSAPLVFYHFHQFQILQGGRFDRLSASYIESRKEPESVYAAYEAELRKTIADVQQRMPGFAFGIKSATHVNSRRWVQRFMPRPVKELMRRVMTRFSGAL